jgi:hypothetical protein
MDWDKYGSLLNVHGDTRRDRIISETKASIKKRAKSSPAYKTVMVDGVEQNLVIVSSQDFSYKKITSLPDEQIHLGSMVDWANQKWLITSVDAEDEVHQRGQMYHCNVCLKWQNAEGNIISRFGVVENMSLFASGTVAARVMDSLQQWYRVQLPVDEETVKIRRDKRFLMDIVQDEPNAYIATNREVIMGNTYPEDIDGGYTFNGRHKILAITLCQTQLSDADNTTLMIADYVEPHTVVPVEPVNSDTVNITYSGQCVLKSGGSFKTFKAVFTDVDGEVLSLNPSWSVTTLDGYENVPVTSVTDSGDFKIKIPDCPDLVNTYIRISVEDSTHQVTTYIDVKVVSIYG